MVGRESEGRTVSSGGLSEYYWKHTSYNESVTVIKSDDIAHTAYEPDGPNVKRFTSDSSLTSCCAETSSRCNVGPCPIDRSAEHSFSIHAVV